MKFVIQRVTQATVSVRGETAGSINEGLLVLVGIRRGDTKKDADWMVRKALNMRIFEDREGKMNRSVRDENSDLLLVPNFTLYADSSEGNRPSFMKAEKPRKAQVVYENVIELMKIKSDLKIQSGEFGADMQVSLVNDGPVTIVLESD